MKEKIENIIVTLTLYKFVDKGQLQLEILRLIYVQHVFLFQPFARLFRLWKCFKSKKGHKQVYSKKLFYFYFGHTFLREILEKRLRTSKNAYSNLIFEILSATVQTFVQICENRPNLLYSMYDMMVSKPVLSPRGGSVRIDPPYCTVCTIRWLANRFCLRGGSLWLIM